MREQVVRTSGGTGGTVDRGTGTGVNTGGDK